MKVNIRIILDYFYILKTSFEKLKRKVKSK